MGRYRDNPVLMERLAGARSIRQPSSTAAAASPETLTNALLDSYDAWLFHERWLLRLERFGREALAARDTVPLTNAGALYHVTGPNRAEVPPPSSRAPIVLAVVGCRWRD